MSLRELMVSIGFTADTTPLIEINDGMDDLTSNLDDVGDELGSVGDLTTTTTKGMKDRFSDLGSGMRDFGKKMSLGVTAPIAGIATAGFAAANDLDSAYNDIQIGTGATGDTLKGLKEDFREVFQSVPNSADEVSNALATVNTFTGATDETLQDVTETVLNASRMLGEDGVANSEAFGQAMQQWQIPAEDGTDFLDKMFKATQDYGVGLGDLSGHLSTYGSVLSNAGFSMDESADLFGRLEANGISVSRVMPGLNSAFRNWASEGKNGQEELQKVIEAMQDAETRTEALSIAEGEFGAEGAQRLTTAIRNDAFPAIDELGVALEGTSGLIDNTSEDTLTFGDRIGEMKNRVQTSLEPLGETLLDTFESFLPYVEQGIDWLSNLAEQFRDMSPATKNTILAIGGIAALLGPLLIGLGAVVGFVPNLVNGFKLVTGALKIFNLTLLTSPITWIVVGIVGLIATIILLWKNWDEVSQWLSSSMEWLKETTVTVFSAIGEWISNIFTSIVDWIVNAWNSALEWTSSILGSVWGAVVNIFTSIVESISEWMNNAWTTITDIWGEVESFFTNINLFDIGKDIIRGLIDGIASMGSAIWDTVKGIGSSITDGFKSIFRVESPSKEMTDLFEDVGAGIPIGLDNSAADVERSAQDLADTANPASYTPDGGMYQTSGQPISIGDIKIVVEGVSNQQEAERAGRAAGKELKRQVYEMIESFNKKQAVREV